MHALADGPVAEDAGGDLDTAMEVPEGSWTGTMFRTH
jgi:hypothetical protein